METCLKCIPNRHRKERPNKLDAGDGLQPRLIRDVRRYFEIDNKAKKEAASLVILMKGGEKYANT